jgi:conjugal transfer pilus assembly protein TraL
MESPREFYVIPKHLNKGKTIVGLPMDEVLPALIIFAAFFATKHQLIAIVVATLWFVGLRMLKNQYGDNIIALSAYWFGSSAVSSSIFKRSPSAARRYWLF